MLNLDFVETYFEGIATENIAIGHTAEAKHFMYLHFEEMFKGVRNNLLYPALVLHESEIRITDYRASQFESVFSGGFSIVKDIGKGGDAEREAAMKLCTDIARQIMGRMKKDRNELVIGNVDFARFNITPVGPLMGMCYGVLVDFNLAKPVNIDYVDAEWNS
jgi:hypothetical protein